MQESFLHFVWQNQYFQPKNLFIISGQSLQIVKPGNHNLHAGPDFLESEIEIDGIRWSGSIEIHLKSSDWYAHNHQSDARYENVILHVVYEQDKPVKYQNGELIPTLELKGLIKPALLNRYQELIGQEEVIKCANQLDQTRAIVKLGMLERVLIERLEEKALLILELLEINNGDWEETAYQWLFRGMGFKVNSENMLTLSLMVPSGTLRKYHDLFQYEALLFGASGLLNIDVKGYPNQLREEYLYLKQKHAIKDKLSYNEWHYARVRPSNYPSIRIAQLASLLHSNQSLLSLFMDFDSPAQLIEALHCVQSEYWQLHYLPGKLSRRRLSGLTRRAIQNLIINTAAPLLVAFGRYSDRQEPLENALNLLMAIPAERNTFIEKWERLHWRVSSAFDSQGLLQLHNAYCLKKKCIQCGIGASLIRG